MYANWMKSAKAAFAEWFARSEAASPRERLRAEIEAEIEENPHPAEGAVWASRPQEWWAERVGVSGKTIQRLTRKPPFKWVRKLVEGVPTVLLREVAPGEQPSAEDFARMLVAVWRKHWRTKDRETPVDFGRLVELGKLWKAQGPAILTTVLDDWPGFMQCVELHQLQTGEGEKKYYDFPSTGVILKYRSVAADHHKFKLQEEAGSKLVKAQNLM